MYRSNSILIIPVLAVIATVACGKRHSLPPTIETRPLEGAKAARIIEEVLSERGYSFDTGATIRIANSITFPGDYRIKGEAIAIKFVTDQDRDNIETIPEPAAGSRLHVLAGVASSGETGGKDSRVYVFFIDNRDFVYHANPTSETRADVTFLEVDSRLRRDLKDFLTWYENSGRKR